MDMTVDPALLARARATAARLGEVETELAKARAEHHTAIRRMHLAGASLREIAEALSLSHQRVAQIVADAGGSWWQRIWRTRNARVDMVCTFCDRPPSELGKLLAGPNVFVCDECVAQAERALQGRPKPGSTLVAARSGSRGACSFCGRRRSVDRALAVAARARICAECLAVSRQILEEREA
jgi:hypothetical protein